MERPQISNESLLKASENVMERLGFRLEQKGRGIIASNHESLGLITEEYQELIDSIHDNDVVEIANELHDVAVAAIFSIASLLEKEELLKNAAAKLEATLSEV